VNVSGAKKENPSVATLDTLARYVLGAPYTSEIQRKNDESHYPYWFLYREKFIKISKRPASKEVKWRGLAVAGIVAVILLAVYFKYAASSNNYQFTDNFKNLNENAMLKNGWFIKSKDTGYWNKRSEEPGLLTLYTLKGDNWPDPAFKPDIKNLLLREIPSGCFTTEAHLGRFIPKQEWQQAGILLLEDTLFTG